MNSDNPHKDKDRYENEEIDLAFSIGLREDLNLLGRWNYGLSSNQTLDSLFGLESDDCWSAKLVLRRHREKLSTELFR